jgi:hypothetical protein
MGYGNNTAMYDDALNRLNNTKDVDVRDPFIGEGDSKLLLLELVPFGHATHGPSAKAIFEVLESQAHKPGTRVVKLWNLTKPSKFPNQANDADRFADFVRKMSGSPDGTQVGPICAALLRDRVADQLLRGMIIKATGIQTSKNPEKPFVDVRWATIQQSQEQIREWRTKIEHNAVAAPGPGMPAAAPTPYVAPTPVPATNTSPTLLSQIPGFGK